MSLKVNSRGIWQVRWLKVSKLSLTLAAAFSMSVPASAQQAPPPDIALLFPETLHCYQNLTRVHAADSIGSPDAVIQAIERASGGDLSLLDALPEASNTNQAKRIRSHVIRHGDYASAMRVAAEAHNIRALRVLYAACNARNARNMQKLYNARDDQVMTAAHHVTECYYPRPPLKSDSDQCIGTPPE